MIKREIEKKKSLNCKGEVRRVDEKGIVVWDEKTGNAVLTYDDFKAFVGCDVKISVSESSKTEVDEFDEDEDMEDAE